MPHRPRQSLFALTFATLLIFLGGGACHHLKSSQPTPEQPKTMVYVANGEFLDAVIYVVDRGQNVRLGVATSNQTTRFEIPAHLVFGATPLSFRVAPIGAPSRPSTGEVVIDPGDEIDLRLSGGRIALSKRPR
jgi:hypothetical protein